MSNTCTINEPLFFIDEYVANGAIRCHAYWDADEAFHDWADFKADSTVPYAELYKRVNGIATLSETVSR